MSYLYNIRKKSLLILIAVIMSFVLGACDKNSTDKVMENKEKLENKYIVEYIKTSDVENADNSLSISIKDKNIEEKDGLIIFVYSDFSLPKRSYILYFNHDHKIPAGIYYPVEPIKMLYEDKKEYEDYKQELENAYQELLNEMDITNDDLFAIARYVYENE